MKKHLTPLVLTIILLIALSACTRVASTPPPATATLDLTEIHEQATGTALAQPDAVPVEVESSEEEAAPEEAVVSTATPVPEPISTMPAIPDYEVPTTYTLHKGEFPYCLARRFNINQDSLLTLNGLSINVQLPAGYTLQIPQSAGPFFGPRALKAHPSNYTVLAGDTFYSIACLFGDVDPRAIAVANGMGVSESLSAGKVIQIP